MSGVLVAVVLVPLVVWQRVMARQYERRIVAMQHELEHVRALAMAADAFACEYCDEAPLVVARIRAHLAGIILPD